MAGTQVASLFGVLDLDDKATGKLGSFRNALGAVGKLMGGISALGIFGKAIGEASEAQSGVAQLDAVLKSTSGNMAKASTTAGHWAKVTHTSGDNVKEWTSALKAAEGMMGRLSAKQAAGIALTGSEHAAYAKATQAAQAYRNALAGATTTMKVWVDGQQQGVTVSHMARDAYIDLASNLQKVTRFSDDTILSAESMLLTFTKIGKDVFPAATETVLDMSQALGQDTKASAIQLGKALNDPIEGITALRRVGVTFSNEQERMIKQLVRSGKLMDAQKLILKELQTEFGGSARAAGETFAGQLDILHNAVSDVFESLGNMLLPVLSQVVTGFGNLIDALGPAAPIILAVVAALAGLPLILGLIASPLTLIIAAVGLVGAAFATNFGGIRTTIEGVWNAIKGPLETIRKGISDFFSTLFDPKDSVKVISGPNGLTAIIEKADLGSKLAAAFAGLGPQIKKAVEDLFTNLGIDPAIITKVADAVKGPLEAISTGVTSFIASLSEADFSGVNMVLSAIGNALAVLAGAIAAVGLATLQAIGQALPGIGEGLADFITGLSGALKGDPEGLKKMADGIRQIAEAIAGIPLDIATKIGSLLGIDVEGGLAAWQGIRDNIGIILGEIKTKIETAVNDIKAAWDKFWADPLGSFRTAIENVINGAVDWINNTALPAFKTAFEGIVTAVGGILGGIKGAIIGPIKAALRAISVGLKVGGLDKIPGLDTLVTALDAAIAGMASGGPVSGGTPYIVGEKGPELFVPGASGSIVPNRALGGGMTVVLNAYGVSDPVKLVNMVDSELKRRNRPMIGKR